MVSSVLRACFFDAKRGMFTVNSTYGILNFLVDDAETFFIHEIGQSLIAMYSCPAHLPRHLVATYFHINSYKRKSSLQWFGKINV